jgi:hypothetical protein
MSSTWPTVRLLVAASDARNSCRGRVDAAFMKNRTARGEAAPRVPMWSSIQPRHRLDLGLKVMRSRFYLFRKRYVCIVRVEGGGGRVGFRTSRTNSP